jgi:DNA-binding GntR family transcriptional regulator
MQSGTTNNNATEGVYREIRSRILKGNFQIKQRINQNTLADELHVSRTPVIKALHMLEADGLVDNIPNRGFYIHVPTLREITELFMLRQSFEMISAMYVAEFGTDEQFDELDTIFSEFNYTDKIDREKYFEADKAFHKRIFEMCDNSIIHNLDRSMQIFDRSFMVGLLRPPQETLKEHLDIIQTLRSRDPVRAQDMARAHTESTKRHLLNIDRQIRTLGINPDTLSLQDAIQRQ